MSDSEVLVKPVRLPFTHGFYRGRSVGNELQVGVGRFPARQETHRWSIRPNRSVMLANCLKGNHLFSVKNEKTNQTQFYPHSMCLFCAVEMVFTFKKYINILDLIYSIVFIYFFLCLFTLCKCLTDNFMQRRHSGWHIGLDIYSRLWSTSCTYLVYTGEPWSEEWKISSSVTKHRP